MLAHRFIAVGAAVWVASIATAQPAATPTGNRFVVLGTASGPNSEVARAQPANSLIVDGRVYLVDCGDGAVAQLAKAGLRLPAYRACC